MLTINIIVKNYIYETGKIMGERKGTLFLSFLICLAAFTIIDISFDYIRGGSGQLIYVNETGSNGAFNKIQDAIDAASNGDTVYVYSGYYKETLDINKSIILRGEDKSNTTIRHWPDQREIVRILSDGVHISGFTIRGNGYFADKSGIILSQVKNCNISDNNIIECEQGIYLYYSSNNTIFNNTVYSHNKYGVRVHYSRNNTFLNNNITWNGRDGILLGTSDNCTFINNHIDRNEYNGISISYSGNTTLRDNSIIDSGIILRGDELRHWNTHTIDASNSVNGKSVYYWKNRAGGMIPSNAGQVILANCQGVEVKGQNVSDGSVGISLAFSQGNIIAHNVATSNKWYGIFMQSSSNNTIENNTISRGKYISTYVYCISLWYSDDNVIRSNNISNNHYGVYLFRSNNNSVLKNRFNNVFSWSIYLSHSDDNTINYNNIIDGYGGLWIQSSESNLIANNTLIDHYYVIYMNNSAKNHIHHNNFIRSIYHAFDDGESNYWDDGYPSGGNFWSIYNGSDKFSGPNQDIPGNDGIGDTNFTFDEDSSDNYPLRSPVGSCIYLYRDWNLISIPFIQSDTNLGSVLTSIKGAYDAIRWYDITDTLNPWKQNSTKKPSYLNDLDKIDNTMGLWIHVTEPKGILFQYPGTQPMGNQTINIHPGWNLIGYPSLTRHNRTAGLNNIIFGTHVDAIWAYDSATQTWFETGPADDFEVGRGYWVHANVEMEWQVMI
jgi:parallel beta-helix repeat protein